MQNFIKICKSLCKSKTKW